jgi:hypothetical protein
LGKGTESFQRGVPPDSARRGGRGVVEESDGGGVSAADAAPGEEPALGIESQRPDVAAETVPRASAERAGLARLPLLADKNNKIWDKNGCK